ncbi:MAG: CoB--CoM heterodisulfide reductase subunit B [Thermoplasmata archaeon]|nr:CoB--CoM heterodisulfide reductase subunit B [Thermoplasmata archaeon]
MSKYAFFLGCIAPARALNYDASTRKVAEALGIELIDLEGFACCGFPIWSIEKNTSLVMASRNLAVAEENKLDIITICSACSFALTKTNKRIQENDGLRERINDALTSVDKEYKGTISVKHFARFLYEDVGLRNLRKKVEKKLTGLKIAAHYGCFYLKPSDVFDNFDDPDSPSSLDELIEVTGATSIEYKDKQQCCGGAIMGIKAEKSQQMTKQKLDHIKETSANAMTLTCPFCGVLYEDQQKEIERESQEKYGIPVLYYPQLLGLAFGFNSIELGLNRNRIKTEQLVDWIEK